MNSVAYRPLQRATSEEALHALIDAIPKSDYGTRRQLYESIDLIRFTEPKRVIDVTRLLKHPAEAPEDQLNYAIQWSLATQNRAHMPEVVDALKAATIRSSYARKMAIGFVGVLGSPQDREVLFSILTSDPSAANRAEAALFLARHADERSIERFQLNRQPEIVRYQIARGLLGSRVKGVLELVLPLLHDKSFYVRRAAAMTVISLKDKRGIPVLLETLQYETLDTGENYGDNIYNRLGALVGVNFGTDRAAWQQWWKESGDRFVFPE